MTEWITSEMKDAYIQLHNAGYAHSVEAWNADELAGGLYGVILGRLFSVNRCLQKKNDASKVAFVKFAEFLIKRGFELIDCQVTTRHLMNFGQERSRRRIPRDVDKSVNIFRPAEGILPQYLVELKRLSFMINRKSLLR